jgi:DNA-binding CsgD family transcriptional regulator
MDRRDRGQSRQQFRSVLDGFPVALGYVGADRRLQVANATAARWLGSTPAALRGCHVREALGPRNYERVRPAIDAVLEGAAQTFECVFTTSGAVHRALVSLTPDVPQDSVVGFFVAVATREVVARPASQAPGGRKLEEIDGVLVEGLTGRERCVLELLSTYRSSTEIAEALHVSVNTVKTHVKAIYRKLGVNSRRAAIERGIAADLLPDRGP